MTGKFFQEFREKKNQSIMNTSEGIVTPQFLRKYERENGDIRFSNLLQLLGRLNITFDEFVFEIDDSMDVWLYKIEEEIDQAYHAGNSFLLKNSWKIKKNCIGKPTKNDFFLLHLLENDFTIIYSCLVIQLI